MGKDSFSVCNCNYCDRENWDNTSVFDCRWCESVTDFSSLEEDERATVKEFWCYGASRVTFIPFFPNVSEFMCMGCSYLMALPELPKLESLNVSECTLLTEWKRTEIDNISDIYCEECPLLHLHPSIFIRFGGVDKLTPHPDMEKFPRPRNGVSSKVILAFRLCKILYCTEIPSRVAKEVNLNSIDYAPGGSKYLELAVRYQDGIDVAKKRMKIS